MAKKIKLLRHRNIGLTGCPAGTVLEVGVDLPLGTAETLVRIGNAEWHKAKKITKKPAPK